MPRLTKKIYYFVPTHLAGKRYLPGALESHVDIRAYGQEFKAWLTLPSTLTPTSVIMVNGIRFCDRLLVSLAILHGCKIIIIQHGRNEYFQSLNMSAIFRKLTSSRRYWREAIFLGIVGLHITIRKLLHRDRSNNAMCKLYHFSEDYDMQWSARLDQLKTQYLSVPVKPPDPLTWGTVTPIPRVDHLSCFMVDEPLDVTLGLSDDEFFKILNEFLEELGVNEVFVKKHPRCDVNKFREQPRFSEIDSIPKQTKVLIGYKSNLLHCGISADQFFQVSLSGIVATRLESKQDITNIDDNTYDDLSLEEIICDLV